MKYDMEPGIAADASRQMGWVSRDDYECPTKKKLCRTTARAALTTETHTLFLSQGLLC